jgi:hydrogenase expression/formation protein HypC
MCLGIPGRVVEIVAGYGGQLAMVDVQGAERRINLGMLEPDEQHLQPGEWILIHMGFAIERIDQAAAESALDGLRMMGSGPTTTSPPAGGSSGV